MPAGDLAVLCASRAFTVNMYTWFDEAQPHSKQQKRQAGGGTMPTVTQTGYYTTVNLHRNDRNNDDALQYDGQ